MIKISQLFGNKKPERDDMNTQEQEQNIVEENDTQLSDAEIKAAEQGWTPEDQWHGDPDKWVNAEEFLNRGEKHNGILRERNEKLIAEVSALKQELRDSVKQFGEATRQAETRAYNKAMKTLKQQQLEAVQNGDTEMWAELEDEKTSLQTEYNKANQPQQQQYNPDTDPHFISWHSNNQWYNDDLDMTVYANQIAPIVANKVGNNSSPEFYNAISNEIRKKYPDKFRNVNRDRPSPVQGAAQEGGKPNNRKGKGYNDLPEEAKKACDRFVKQNVMTQDEYLAEYFS